MKKILSILICVLLSVGSIYAAKAHAKAELTLTAQPSGVAGYVEVSKTSISNFTNYTSWSTTQDHDMNEQNQNVGTFLGGGYKTSKATIYGYAAVQKGNGYTFMGFSGDGNKIDQAANPNSSGISTYSYQVSHTTTVVAGTTITGEETFEHRYIYAIFKPIISCSTKTLDITKTGDTGTGSFNATLCNPKEFKISVTKNGQLSSDLTCNVVKVDGNAATSVNETGEQLVEFEVVAQAGAKKGDVFTITLTATNDAKHEIIVTIYESIAISFLPPVKGKGSYTYLRESNGDNGTITTSSVEFKLEKSDKFTLAATPANADYRFDRWVFTKGEPVYTNPYLYTSRDGDEITAEFVESKYAMFMIKGKEGIYYNDLNLAIDATGGAGVVVVYQSGLLASGSYTIPSGVTLLIPGDAAYTVPKGDLTVADFDATTTVTCYRQLIMEDNTTITVANGGAMAVYAKMTYYQTQNGKPYSFGRLDLANNCHIDIQSGAMLHALGYITGDPTQSSVTIRSGATMYEAFQIRDWRGGSAVLEVAGSSTDDLIAKLYSGEDIVVSSSDTKVFPVGQYYLQTVETKLVLEAGAVEMITTAANMSLSSLGEVELVANAPFVVPDNANYPTGFFRLGNNARFVKYYDRDKDRQVYQIEGIGADAKAGFGILQMTFPMTVNVSFVEKQCKVIVSSEGYVLPIVNNLDVTLDNIELEVPYDINLLGDASVTINKNATVKIKKNFFVSDVEESKGMWYVGSVGNGTIFPITNTLWNSQYLLDNAGKKISSKDATHIKDANLNREAAGNLYKRQVYDIAAYTNDIPMRDATVVVDGKLIVDGYLYTTKSGANITSTGGGKVIFNKVDHSTGDKLYRYLQSKEPIPNTKDTLQIGFHAIPVTNAKLHNDETKNPDEPYAAGAEANAGDVYTYVQSLGKWMLPQEMQIVGHEGNMFNLTLPNDLTQNLVCDVDTESPDVSLNNFEVILPANTRFTKDNVKYENSKLTIQLTYAAQNVHNADNPYKETITVRCKDLASGAYTDEPIELTATENYQPVFKVTIDGKDYADGSTYPLITGANVGIQQSFDVVVSADANNVANAYATWTKVCASPFTFDYGTRTETPYANALFSYLPTTAGTHTGDLSITATYTDAAGVTKDSTITIHFSAEASLQTNPLDFAQFPQPIYTTTPAFELIDAATNVARADIEVTPKTGIVEITGTGKLDDPYIVTPKNIGIVTITATQAASQVYQEKTIYKTITVIDPVAYPVPFCINEETGLTEFNKRLYGGTNVSYNATNNTIDFNSTTSSSEWIFRFNGTPDKLTFTPTGSNLWSVQQRSSETAEWKDILVWSSLTSGAEVSYQLDPTTCQVRIQYGSANPEVGTLENVCVSKLLISADVNKLYLPIEKGKISVRTITLTHTQNAVPTITLTEGLTYTADKSENLGTAGAPYYKTTVTISTTASTVEDEYEFTATEDNNTVKIIVSAYNFPQELPIKLAEDDLERYYFITTTSSYVQWDAINRQVVMQNPGSDLVRSITFAFNGAPSILSFKAYSAAGEEIIVDSVWTIYESVDGTPDSFYPSTLPRDSVESNLLVQELHYTTRYVRINYKPELSREIRLSELVIEGYPSVIVEPEKMDFRTGSANLNPQKLAVIAINLQEIDFELDNTNAFQISTDTAYATTDWHDAIHATEDTHASALGKNKVDTIFLGVKWLEYSALDEGSITIRNKKDRTVLATVPLVGANGYLMKDNADETGIYTGIPAGNTFHGAEYKDYSHHQVNLTNAFDRDGIAMFDYLFIYGETTPAEGTDITAPKKGSADGSTNIGSNAVTPFYVYRKAPNSENQYRGYQYVGKIDNANTEDKAVVADIIITDTAGVVYIDATNPLRVYMTGFCPYATTGYTKNQEGVFLFRGKHGAKLDIYLEDFHVFSRNKTKNGNGFYGDKEGGEVFTDGYARGSGGVLVFENVDPQEQLQNYQPFDVSIHTIGDNLLNSNYGCFFGLSVVQGGGVAMKATQVSSPIHVHMFNKSYARKTMVTLNFTDEWPIVVNADNAVIESKRTNGFLALKKQANNAPSIDMGNKHTTVNFKGGRVELQNSQIGSDTYKTTLAISHRSGYFGSDDAGIQLCYGIGTDSVGGTVNFLDGTVTIKPMYVAPAYRQYYLMDVQYNAKGDTVRDASENIVYSDSTSCLRAPMNTYVKGGSICRVRACQHVTSKGGAPKDSERGKYLGQYVYTLQADKDTIATTTKLAHIIGFPANVQGLETYYTSSGYTYGLNSVTPDRNNQFYFWIPDGFGGVTAEQDKLMSTWKACMTEIAAGIPTIAEGRIGGDTPIEQTEEVKYFLYCKIDDDIKDVIRAGEKNAEGEVVNYTYLPPFEVPSAAKGMFKDAKYARYDLLTYVSDSLQYQVVSDTAYTITDRVYYITTATADIWQTFTAPFNVANIYVMETYSENELMNAGTRAEILKAQAAHNADFAAFFAVEMAMGTNKDFDGIYDSYIEWAKSQDRDSLGLWDGTGDYTLRTKQRLIPYVGKNWREANFYLNENKGNWTLNDETGYFDVNWETLTADSLTKDILLHKGKTYSLMFPYCPNCEEDGSLDSRTDWDYWSGKFLIFESTAGAQVINGRDFLNDTVAGHIFTQAPGETEVVVTGNSTFARLETNKENLYVYESGYPMMNSEIFLPPLEDAIIQPTTAFLYGYVPTNAQGMPAKAISRTGQIIYDKENTPTGNQGGHLPTVGGGNDLFITSTATGINIAVAEPQQVRVMSATGAIIFSGMVQTAVDVFLPTAGVYVVAGENEVHKILH